jgi:phosphoglucosamine mutase
MILSELGAEVFSIGVQPNGQNINLGVGSLHPEIAAEDVKKFKAEVGICLDGDADRVVIIDELGEVINGDILIGILAKFALDSKQLKKGDEIVGTVMSNMALENFIKSIGLKFFRSKVGDRYILERMKTSNAPLGGEPSGHIIWPEVSRTGDGILSALKIIEAMYFYGKKLSELRQEFELYPQLTTNVSVKKKTDFNSFPEIVDELKKQEIKLGGKGRILLRYSGTEPLARVMVEGESLTVIEQVGESLAEVVTRCLG